MDQNGGTLINVPSQQEPISTSGCGKTPPQRPTELVNIPIQQPTAKDLHSCKQKNTNTSNTRPERYNGPTYNNLEVLLESGTPFAKKLKNTIKRIPGEKKQGAQVYEAIKDIPELEIKSGDVLYLDTLHKDHIEIFNGRKPKSKVRTVLSVNGSILHDKAEKANRKYGKK